MMYLLLVILGLCFGSFVNALTWRLRKQESSKSKKYSIITGHSMCPGCRHRLAWYDLIPVLSWLLLVGKCRYCKKPISFQYPLVELTTSLLFVTSYIFWPIVLIDSWQYLEFITWLVVVVGFVALAVYDIKWMLLPDKIIYPLVMFTVISIIIQTILGRPYSDIPSICLSVLISSGLFWILYQLSQGKWIGGGDVKLGILVGLVLSTPSNALLYIFMASLLGTLYSTPYLINKKLKTNSKIAFGPFLIASAIIVGLFGQTIIDWYLSIIAI